VANDLNNKEEWRYPQDRAGEMLHVPHEAMLSEPLKVIVNEHADSTAGGNVEVACRREKAWNQAQKVSRQDVDREGSDDRDKAVAFFSDHLTHEIPDSLKAYFNQVLNPAGIFDAEPASQPPGENNKAQCKQQNHDDMIRHSMVAWNQMDS
jgi:hypothetical protein